MPALARTRILALSVAALSLISLWISARLSAPPTLRIEPVPVGKGAAYLVRAPNGATVLINAGSDASILRALGTRLPPWQRSLAVVVLTDPGVKSAVGLPSVLDRYRVPLLIRSATRGSSSREQALAVALKKQGARALPAVEGMRLVLGGGAFVDVLWPNAQAARGTGPNTTIVARISYGSTSFVIEPELPERTRNWLAQTEQRALAGALFLSSTSPPAVSDGRTVTTLK